MATLTLIGPDVEVVCNACSGVHDLWANPVEIGLATWLLSRLFSSHEPVSEAHGAVHQGLERRHSKLVSVTSRVVGSIWETKMLGLVPVCLEYILSIRVFELKESR
ncbi:hypothetical protein MY10362_002741 [Beauveria mimosiformis]